MKELGDITMLSGSYLVGLAFFVVAVIVIIQAFRVVPQQPHGWSKGLAASMRCCSRD